jgi:hypothetical protein
VTRAQKRYRRSTSIFAQPGCPGLEQIAPADLVAVPGGARVKTGAPQSAWISSCTDRSFNSPSEFWMWWAT